MVIQVHVVGATCMSMHERFTMLAAAAPVPRPGPAPRRARRRSTNAGPLFSNPQKRNQNLIEEVVRQLELQWKRQELQQRLGRGRSRAGSLGRFVSESSLPGLRRSNSWGNLSQANSVGGLSQRSKNWRQSNGNLSARSVSFASEPGFNLGLRNVWQRGRGRRGRPRRARGGHIQRGRVARPNQPFTQRGAGGRRRGTRGRGGGAPRQPASSPVAGPQPGVVTRSASRGDGRGRGRGRGAAQRGGVSQSTMPTLKTLEQLDRELDEYMAGSKARLDKDLEEYMAQNGMDLDLSL